MATPGIANKPHNTKKKATTLPLTTFLRPETTSWADDEEDTDTLPVLPTAPGGGGSAYSSAKTASEPDVSRLPDRPPFKAYIGNLTHTISPQELGEYFHPAYQVVDVTIIRHHDTGNVRGAFVEFETQADLRGALAHNGRFLRDRPMRVDVASDKSRSGHDRHSNYDDRSGYGSNRRGGYGERGVYSDRGGFGAAYEDMRVGSQEEVRGGGFSGDRSAGRDRYRSDHGGGYTDRGHPDRRGGGPDAVDFGNRRPKDRGGFSGAPDEELDAPRWGHKLAPQPRASPPPAVADPTGPPAERKKLILAPRSKAADQSSTETADNIDKPKKSNPFGDAKPVDASARLKELEEKIARQKAEEAAALAKAKEEKEQREREEKEREAKEKAEAERTAAELKEKEKQVKEHEQQEREAKRGEEAVPSTSIHRQTAANGRPAVQPPVPAWDKPPSTSGRNTAQQEAPGVTANGGHFGPPPGTDTRVEGGRGYGRGRRGRGREGGQGMHGHEGPYNEFGREGGQERPEARGRGRHGGDGSRGRLGGGRGRYSEQGRGVRVPQFRGHQQHHYQHPAHQVPAPVPPQVQRRTPSSSESGFQEDKRSKGRTRGWETHTPASAPKQDVSQQESEKQGSEKAARGTNIYDILTED